MRVHGLLLPLPKSEPARPARHRGWLPRVLAGIVALAVAIVAISALDLNRPWVKRRVQALVQASSGLDVDYGSIRLHLLSGGAEVDDLVVHTAQPELRAFAPDLARAARVDVRWTASSLFGHGPRIEQIVATGVAVAVVVDEQGRTSLDALGLSMPPVPRSQQAGQLLASALPARRIDVAGMDLAVIWTKGGRVVERDRVRGLGAALAAEPGRQGWWAGAAAGSANAPLDLDLTRERGGTTPGTARAKFSLAAEMTASVLNVACDLNVLEQSIVPGVGAGDWHAEASARFDPAAGRTTLALDHVRAAAGAATAEASLEVPDLGDPIVRHAQGDVDVARLLAWVPAELVPITAERALLHYRVDSAILGPLPRLTAGGGVHVDVDLSNARVRTSAGVIDVDGGRLVLDGRPLTGSGMAVWGSEQIDGARVESPHASLDVRRLVFDVDGERAGDGALTGRLDARFGRLRQDGGGATVVARDGWGEVRLERLVASASEPLGARGNVAVSADVASLDVRLPSSRVSADSVALEAHGRLQGGAPYGGALDARASGLEVFAGGKRLVARAPARVGVYLQDALFDADHPLASEGAVRAAVDFDHGRASVDAVKRGDAMTYTVRVAASSLKALRPFLPPALAGAAGWDSMGVALRSTGRVERIATDPQIEQDTSLEVERPAFEGISARSLSLELHSEGTMSRHQATANVRLSALAIEGAPPSDDAATLSVTVDRDVPSLHLQAGLEGRAHGQLDASAAFDRTERAVVYDVDGRLSNLVSIGPFVARVRGLEGFDLSRLELGFAARGTLRGVVSNVGLDGAVDLEPEPLRTAAIEGTSDVRAANLRWARGQTALEAPSVVWHGEMRSDGARRTVEAHADVESLRLGLGHRQVDLVGIRDDVTAAVTGDLRNPTIELTERTAIRAVQQDLAVDYPVGDVSLALSARRDTEGLVRVSSMNVHNGNAGTTLVLQGGVDLVARRRRLSMTVSLAQDLEPLSVLPESFAGGGKVEVTATVESPDLAVFRTHLDLKLAGVHLRMPGLGVEADAVDGTIPISVVFDEHHGAVAIRRDVRPSPFARLRFADRHPLLRHGGFLSIGRLVTPRVTIAPFIGNLAVEQNVVSLRQFEMGVRSGWVTGESALVWDGPDSTLELSLRASDVRSSRGEPFDGNVEVVVAASNRMIEGRAEVIRMGRRHLLDLLDMEDPLRVDPSTNRVRSALDWGYPRRMRVVFDNGFASAHIELGGLAKFWSLDDLRGIPTGPFVDRLAAALLDPKAAP